MDHQNSESERSSRVKKCPYYDPETRDTLKPGKTCPNYNSAKGCPYAHPFEFEKWDGKAWFAPPAAATSNSHPSSSHPPAPAQENVNNTILSNRSEADSARMEIDSRQSRPTTPADTARMPHSQSARGKSKGPTFVPASQNPASAPPLPLQREAVEQFLSHVLVALHNYQVETGASEGLWKFKSAYKSLCKSYADAAVGEDLRDIISPGAQSTWMVEKKKRQDEVEHAGNQRWAWIDGLLSMNGRARSNPLRIEGGEDTEMRDASAAIANQGEVVLTEREDTIIDALDHYRARLHRGVIGEEITDLRTRIDRIRDLVKERGIQRALLSLPSNMPESLVDTGAGKEDASNISDLRVMFKSLTADLHRLEDLQQQVENMDAPIDDVEDWATANVDEEWFQQEMRAAIEKITQEFLRQGREPSAAANSVEELIALGWPNPSETMKRMRERLEKLEDLRNTSETLLRLAGPVEVLDDSSLPHFSLVLQRFSTFCTNLQSDLHGLLQPIEEQHLRFTSLLPLDQTDALNKISEFHKQTLSKRSPLKEVRQPLLLSAHLPPHRELQEQERNAWFAEFEELKRAAGKIVDPLVALTDAQEDKLMQYEKGRRSGVVHSEEGAGPVSTRVSEGAMG